MSVPSHFAGQPTANWSMIQRRAELLKQVRQFFDGRGFTEVQTPVLSRDTVVDRHLDPIAVPVSIPGKENDAPLWLQTSPEFAMKRVLARHSRSIYQITPAFRLAERGDHHNLEFTMLEWYGVGHDQQQAMDLLGELAAELFGAGSARQISYRQAFADRWSINPHSAELAELAKIGNGLGQAPKGLDRDGWLDWILTESIQPDFALDTPVILYHYPASQAALARTTRADGDDVGERFELFFRGQELANGYHELDDADELRQRMKVTNRKRHQDGKPCLPEDNQLLHAMKAGLPACSGVAMGLDRVLMVQTGAQRIDEVISFPIEIA